jgi:hypothetical protein
MYWQVFWPSLRLSCSSRSSTELLRMLWETVERTLMLLVFGFPSYSLHSLPVLSSACPFPNFLMSFQFFQIDRAFKSISDSYTCCSRWNPGLQILPLVSIHSLGQVLRACWCLFRRVFPHAALHLRFNSHCHRDCFSK